MGRVPISRGCLCSSVFSPIVINCCCSDLIKIAFQLFCDRTWCHGLDSHVLFLLGGPQTDPCQNVLGATQKGKGPFEIPTRASAKACLSGQGHWNQNILTDLIVSLLSLAGFSCSNFPPDSSCCSLRNVFRTAPRTLTSLLLYFP